MLGAQHARGDSRAGLNTSGREVKSSSDHEQRRREGDDHERRGFDQNDLRVAHREELRAQYAEDGADDNENRHTDESLAVSETYPAEDMKNEPNTGSVYRFAAFCLAWLIFHVRVHTHDTDRALSGVTSEKANASTSLSSG